MAQSGYTPIQLYYSTTASAVPTAGNLAPGELGLNIADMKLYCENSSGVVTLLASSSGSSGDVVGPASSTDNAIVRFDGTTGKLVQNSGVTIDDSGNMVVSVNSATDALRITQTGAGNALVVEDSANPDSSPFVVNAAGQLLIGTTTTLPGSTNGSISLVSEGATAPNGNINGRRYSDDANGLTWGVGKSRGTYASPTTIQSGDNVGNFTFTAYDGASFLSVASIASNVDGTPGTNDMPGRLVFLTTADGASAPTERMRIDSAGNVGIGGGATAGVTLDVKKAQTGAAIAYTVAARINPDSTVTTTAYGYNSFALNAVGTSTPTVIHYSTSQGTFSGTAPTNQYGFIVQSSITGATNNYGFYSDIASGTGRWNFYANGTADNYFAGSVGIGATTDARAKVRIAGTLPSSSNTTWGVFAAGTTPSTTTNQHVSFLSFPTPQATSFTLATLLHFYANQGTISGGAVVTDQFGFFAESTLTGATNNYGFYGNIASGTNRWNLYMNGTAENYLGGNLKIGAVTARGTTAGTNHLSIFNGTAPAGTLTNGITLYSASGDFNFMDAAGNAFKVGYRNIPPVGTKNSSYTLQTADVGEYVQVTTGGSITIPDATFAEGDVVSIFNNTTGTITITCSITTAYIAGTDSDKATMTLASRGVATVLFISSTVCVVSGNVT